MACCPSISIIKILQFIVVCCIFGLDIHTKSYLEPNNNGTLLNELVNEIPHDNITIPYLNIKINAESIPTEYISTGTVVAYLIIIFVSFISGLFTAPISRLANVTFCVIGAFLFVVSGSLLINDFRSISFESIKQINYKKLLEDIRNFNLARGPLCILVACLLLLDALCSFLPC
ncbi:uncharacterized protein LOC103568588 [Microplitis demolitor]|uniref:uncharacterized protein LOC103568588 n=1 Tax=Microplitis demolitor TaxID=69319 RepID=UPI0004CCC211|nr:uncharacterized protein LOC103568588 [Microplitis demolitor]XP_053593216.1 uncharacterized protein LOC103568588 [Microplitis demolitor]